MAGMKCAIYARFSSERQNPRSIDDQIEQCRKFAAQQGWEVAEESIYRDEAKTGTNQDRGGFAALLKAVEESKSPRVEGIQCVLVDDTSRISRNQAQALQFYEKLAFAGVRLVAVSQGVDTQSAQAELMLGVHGLIDSVYSRELAQKTHRGMAGAALRGTATGGRCYGYRTVEESKSQRVEEGKGEDMRHPDKNHRDAPTADAAHKVGMSLDCARDESLRLSRWEIHEAEAEVVRRIFTMSAGGLGLKQIMRTLNREGVRSPRP